MSVPGSNITCRSGIPLRPRAIPAECSALWRRRPPSMCGSKGGGFKSVWSVSGSASFFSKNDVLVGFSLKLVEPFHLATIQRQARRPTLQKLTCEELLCAQLTGVPGSCSLNLHFPEPWTNAFRLPSACGLPKSPTSQRYTELKSLRNLEARADADSRTWMSRMMMSFTGHRLTTGVVAAQNHQWNNHARPTRTRGFNRNTVIVLLAVHLQRRRDPVIIHDRHCHIHRDRDSHLRINGHRHPHHHNDDHHDRHRPIVANASEIPWGLQVIHSQRGLQRLRVGLLRGRGVHGGLRQCACIHVR